jgi:hypothetical protein
MKPYLIKNSRAWIAHEKRMVDRLGSGAISYSDKPTSYPVLVHSYISQDLNGYKINHLYVYPDDAEELLELFTISFDDK